MTELPTICPSCSAANRPSRELCARCGVGLDDGVLPPRPRTRLAPHPTVRRATPRQHGRWLVPLVGALVVVALLVLALTVAGLGPFASAPSVPDAEFGAAGYDGGPTPLLLSDVATRTTAPDADAEAPAAIADGDPTTAWRSSGELVPDADELDTVELFLAEPAWIDGFELRNGDHLDREAYDGSSALREVRITFDGGVEVLAELLDLGLRSQAVTLPEPALTTVVRIDVLRRFAGPHDQLAISEIVPLGWPATPDDAALAAERAELEPATGRTGPGAPITLGGRRGVG